LVVEDDAAGAVERRCAVVGLGGESVLVAAPVSEVMVLGSPTPMADALPGWAVALAGATWAAQRAAGEREQACQTLTAERERWKGILRAANEFADAKGYCSDYDEFMEDQGFVVACQRYR
jgi:hypothetical protein